MNISKTFRSYKKFFATLDKLIEFYDSNEYEESSMTLYNHINNCSCGQCHPGYEKEHAAFIDFENRTIHIVEEPPHLYSKDKMRFELLIQSFVS